MLAYLFMLYWEYLTTVLHTIHEKYVEKLIKKKYNGGEKLAIFFFPQKKI